VDFFVSAEMAATVHVGKDSEYGRLGPR